MKMKSRTLDLVSKTTLDPKKKNNSIPCLICSVKRKDMLVLTCSRYTCYQCIQKNLLTNDSKNRYYCEHCKRNHIIKDLQILDHVANKLEKKEAKLFNQQKKAAIKAQSNKKQIKPNRAENSFEILANAAKSSTPKTSEQSKSVSKKRPFDETINDSFKPISGNTSKKSRGQMVKVSSPTTTSFREPSKIFSNESSTESHASTSQQKQSVQMKNKKLKFDFERCADSSNKIHLSSTFKLDDIIKTKKDDDLKINMQPFRDDKLLFAYNDKFTVRDQLGNIIETHPINRGPGTIIEGMCLNDKFIFIACFNTREDTATLLKYDHMFNFKNKMKFESPCFSLECSENSVFFTSHYGYECNEHTVVHVIDCGSL